MHHPPHLVHRACADLGGVATARELDAYGVGRRDLRRALDAGTVIRLRIGVYAVPETPRSVAEAIRHGGVVGCIDVAELHGLWMLRPDDGRAHVSMPPNGRSRPHEGCVCILHWSARPNASAQVSIEIALAQILGCLGAEKFFVCLESALRKRLLDRRALTRLRAAIPAPHRALVDDARWNADSGLESLLRFRLRALGIALRSQVEIPGVGRVDFVLGDRLILEVDGRENHDGPSNRHKDLVRDAAAAALGFRTLRFDYALVVHDWQLVESAILACVESGAHLSPRR
ncbi:DUF559 domain-containing protein [Agromyces protaetiae]|uniref:DUF559 domain-containing protein n=1 Tax=Agromyces protaetiae TaxID=2509455 RepID=A0A4P6FK16_9MICO|nr:type IV toxin-antitoxin system AbiEi family antitoxin domain-containing protein [Agromyces protaetiae]QAY74327.1 DUF559 domain-containing protein [Agromyces protaetiae]